MDVSELPCASLSDAISELLRQVARSEVLSTEDASFRSERRRQWKFVLHDGMSSCVYEPFVSLKTYDYSLLYLTGIVLHLVLRRGTPFDFAFSEEFLKYV